MQRQARDVDGCCFAVRVRAHGLGLDVERAKQDAAAGKGADPLLQDAYGG